ncbi:ArdC family protein [Mucilaginibacter sp. AK015]|uniref:ArdC family protein n=1 Tax=Mucilaginibacter sp. AK015 TaxID=2723072 RepID=UPI00161219B2|nr:zincin-like metallopeptidase domain-containing protein [Mucilaginibacter sp. AK015]MBB5397185.1 antirestriction protein ArdC [Mucilaginibacter sp. AK015]
METTSQTIDVYSIITDRIIAQLEKSVVPWRKPWAESGPPTNFLTKRPYHGINALLLNSIEYEIQSYLSWKQLKAIGGSVLKGEKGHVVVFWKRIPKARTKETDPQKYTSLLRYYKVFNISQCSDIPDHLMPTIESQTYSPISTCDEIIERMPLCPVIKHSKQRAFYDPQKDYINMPKQRSFADIESYYGTMFHELIHSTGHESRLNRKEMVGTVELGSESYSIEELTAEIGACFLSSIAGICTLEIENSVAYINHWLEVLKKNKKLIVYASGQAQRATDFILNKQYAAEE